MVGGVAGLAALGAIASVATSADAYPPGSKLFVAALSVVPSTTNNTFTVNLQVDNAPPQCPMVVTVNGVVYANPVSGPAVPPFKGVSVPVTVVLPPSRDSTSTVEVRTSCAPNKKEKAKTKVVLRRAKVEIDDECRVNKSCKIEVKNFPSGVPVNVVAFRSGPGIQPPPLTTSKQSDKNGTAKVEFSFPMDGTWTVTASYGSSVTASNVVQVKKKK